MHRQQRINALDFDDDDILDDEVDAVTGLESDAFVENRDTLRRDKSETIRRQLLLQTLQVNRFEQTRPEFHVDLISRIDNDFGYRVLVHFFLSPSREAAKRN